VNTVGQKEIGKVMGWYAISMNAGILLGPVLGGIVFERSGYYTVFFMAFGVILLDVMLRLVLIEKKIAVIWFRVTGIKERYWIIVCDAAGLSRIALLEEMQSILSSRSLKIMLSYNINISITDR
jgi:MFS family permease